VILRGKSKVGAARGKERNSLARPPMKKNRETSKGERKKGCLCHWGASRGQMATHCMRRQVKKGRTQEGILHQGEGGGEKRGKCS